MSTSALLAEGIVALGFDLSHEARLQLLEHLGLVQK